MSFMAEDTAAIEAEAARGASLRTFGTIEGGVK